MFEKLKLFKGEPRYINKNGKSTIAEYELKNDCS